MIEHCVDMKFKYTLKTINAFVTLSFEYRYISLNVGSVNSFKQAITTLLCSKIFKTLSHDHISLETRHVEVRSVVV